MANFMMNVSTKFLIFGFIFFFFSILFSLSVKDDDSSDVYYSLINSIYGDNVDDIATSLDYKSGFLKFKQLFVPVPLSKGYSAEKFTFDYLIENGKDNDAVEFSIKSKNIIKEYLDTSDIYLSSSVYLSKSGVSFCYIGLSGEHNYSGLKKISLDHEMAHCYLESRGISSIFEHIFSKSEKIEAINKIIDKHGTENQDRVTYLFDRFLIESYADAISIYKSNGKESYLNNLVMSDRTTGFLIGNHYEYATYLVLNKVNFDFENIDDFELSLFRLLSSGEILDSFLDII